MKSIEVPNKIWNFIYLDKKLCKFNFSEKIMGFFDKVKQGAELAKKGLEKAGEHLEKQLAKKSDSELLAMDSSNRYVQAELQKRGL